MNNNYEELLLKVREIAEHYEQLEKLKKDRKNIESACGEFISFVIAKYQKEEKEISDRMDQEAEKNRNDKEEIIQLTKKQLKAEMQGNPFTGEERLEELKVKAAAHPQKIEALKQIKAEICVSAADMKSIVEYEYAGGEIIRQIQKKAEEISEILSDVRDRIILNCLASLEIPPAMTRFMDDQFHILQNMRKEEIQE